MTETDTSIINTAAVAMLSVLAPSTVPSPAPPSATVVVGSAAVVVLSVMVAVVLGGTLTPVHFKTSAFSVNQIFLEMCLVFREDMNPTLPSLVEMHWGVFRWL